MSFALRIEHPPAGGLRLRFAEPVSTIDMTSETAAHLGSLLAVEARQRLVGVVRTLEAENGSRAVARCRLRGDRQNGVSECFLPKNMPVRVIGAHPHFCDCLDCMSPGVSNA